MASLALIAVITAYPRRVSRARIISRLMSSSSTNSRMIMALPDHLSHRLDWQKFRNLMYDFWLILVALGFQEPFRLNGGHAAGAGCRDSLTIGAILNIAGVKHTRHAGARTALRDDVAVPVKLNLALKRLGVGDVTDGHKESVHVAHPGFVSFHIAQLHRSDDVLAGIVDVLHNGV